VYARAHGRTATRSGNAFISLRSILLCTSVNRIWRIPRVNNLPRGQNRQRACKTDESRFEKGGNRGKNLRSNPVRATRSQRREARVRPVHSRTRLAFLRKSYGGDVVRRIRIVSEVLQTQNNLAQPVSTPGICMRLRSLELVDCVLLHKVPEKKTARRGL
jgi:hypothetical protein